MTQRAKEINTNSVIWKNAILKFLKIFAFCFILCVYIVSILFFVYPNANVKLFRFLELKNAEEASLVRVYEKSEKLSDLYNLIVFEDEQSNFEKELYYLNILMFDDGFDEFCDKLDNSAIQAVGEDKTLIPYLCNTRSYLINQKVLCLINLNQTVDSFVCSMLGDEYLFEYSYTTYVEYIYSMNVNIETKQNLIDDLNITFNLNNDSKMVEELLNERIENLKTYAESELNEIQKIKTHHTLMNLTKGKYLSNLILHGVDDSRTIQAKEEYRAELSAFNDLF